MKIPVRIVNLKHRVDRRKHAEEQFCDKPEFDVKFVEAVEHPKGAYGLWQTILTIVRQEQQANTPLFILCEDDHTFTDKYSLPFLQHCIEEADKMSADLLSGGFSWFANVVQVSNQLFWGDKFNGLQFTIIFNRFYDSILKAAYDENIIADIFMAGLCQNKFVMYPYISTQKEFGYSDVTSKNAEDGYVSRIFEGAHSKLDTLNKVRNYYLQK